MVFGMPRRTSNERLSHSVGREFSWSLLRTPTRRLGERPRPLSTDESPVRAGFVGVVAGLLIRSSSQAGKNAGTPPDSPAAALASSQARLSTRHPGRGAGHRVAEPSPGRLPAAPVGERRRDLRRERRGADLAGASRGAPEPRGPGRRPAAPSKLRQPARGFVPATGGRRAAGGARDEPSPRRDRSP